MLDGAQKEINAELSLTDILHLIRKHKKTVALVFSTSLISCLMFLLLATPHFKVDILLVSNEQDLNSSSKQLSSLSGLTGIPLLNNSNNESHLAYLESKKFLLHFIRSRELDRHIFRSKWDDSKGTWRDHPPSNHQIYNRFVNDIFFVAQDNSTGLITVSLVWKDAKQAAKWLNDLIKELNSQIKKSEIEIIEKNIKYINREISQASLLAPRETLNKIIEKQVEKKMLSYATEDYAFKVIDPAFISSIPHYPKTINSILFTFILSVFIILILIGLMESYKKLKEK